MQHYRVNKLSAPGGVVVKRKDILANDDGQAIKAAVQDEDCPVCDVLRAGEKIASID